MSVSMSMILLVLGIFGNRNYYPQQQQRAVVRVPSEAEKKLQQKLTETQSELKALKEKVQTAKPTDIPEVKPAEAPITLSIPDPIPPTLLSRATEPQPEKRVTTPEAPKKKLTKEEREAAVKVREQKKAEKENRKKAIEDRQKAAKVKKDDKAKQEVTRERAKEIVVPK